MNPRDVSKELLIERLDMLMMSYMCVKNDHLATAYTGTDV